MADNGIRTSNVPLGALVEVLGHADAGGGARALARSSITALADAVRGIVTTDPSGVAGVRQDLSTLYDIVARIEPKVGGIEIDLSIAEALSENIRRDLQSLYDIVARIDPRVGNLETDLNVAEAVSENIRRDLQSLFGIVAGIDPRVGQAQQDARNLYDAVADLYGDTDRLGTDTTTLKAAAALVDAALRAITGVAVGGVQPNLAGLTSDINTRLRAMRAGARPGLTPDGFAYAPGAVSPSALAGPRAALAGLPPSLIVGGDNGAVSRVTGAGIVGMRHAVAIEPGRLYRPRAVVQRRTDPTDPSGDAVAVVVVLLDQGLNYLGTVTVKQFQSLKANDGRQSVETTMSRSAATGPLLPALNGRTRFAVAAAVLYGLDGRTDVEFLDIEDVTSSVLLPAPAANYDARIGAIESQGLPSRVSALESEVAAPSSVRYATKGAAAAAAIPETAQVVELMGSAASGDGGAGLYARAAGATTVNDDTFVSGGVTWRRVDLSDAVMTGILERWWSRRPTAPPDRSGAIWNNGGTWQATP